MKLTTLSAALLLSTTACGSVVGPDDVDVDSDLIYGDEATDIEMPGAPPAKPSPLLLETPRAATTNGNLFTMAFAANSRVDNIIRTYAAADVVEQRFVNTTAEEVKITVDLTPPTGTYSRTLISDAVNIGTQTNHVLCESNNIATFDPRCERTVPAIRELPSSGVLTSSQWTMWVLDEATGRPIDTCVSASPTRIECVIPGRALASYRVMAAGYGFSDLWEGSPTNVGLHSLSNVSFVGALGTPEYVCWDWANTATGFYCAVRYEYARFTAVDRARLEFDPITLTVTADGSAPETMSSPALVWDAGNDDVPGVY